MEPVLYFFAKGLVFYYHALAVTCAGCSCNEDIKCTFFIGRKQACEEKVIKSPERVDFSGTENVVLLSKC